MRGRPPAERSIHLSSPPARGSAVLEEGARQAAAARQRGQESAERLRQEAEAAVAEQSRLARAARGRAEAHAERTVQSANREAQRIRAEADTLTAEALQQIREAEARAAEVRAEQERREQAEADRRRGRIRTAWHRGQEKVPAVLRTTVLVAGIAHTAQREHQLAAMAGANSLLAWLLAVCVDAWVLAAARSKVHREMLIGAFAREGGHAVGCHAARVSLAVWCRCSYSLGLRWPLAEWRRRVL